MNQQHHRIQTQKIKNRIIDILKQQSQSQVSFERLYKDKDITKYIQQTKYQNQAKFKELIKDILKKNTKINIRENSIAYNKRYPRLKNYDSLIKIVSETPQGFIVDDQILDYSYKGIKQDIQKALKKNKFRKIMSSNRKDYYLFSKNCQNQETCVPGMYLGTEFYLDICRKENPYLSNNQNKEQGSKNEKSKKNNAAWNWWVDGYDIAKIQWQKKNNKK